MNKIAFILVAFAILMCSSNALPLPGKRAHTPVVDKIGEVSGPYQLDTGFYFVDVQTNPLFNDVDDLLGVGTGEERAERCLDEFGNITHPVANRLFPNVGGLMLNQNGTFVPQCVSELFLRKNSIKASLSVMKPANWDCAGCGTKDVNPGWTIFYHQERHGEESLRPCRTDVISATRFSVYPDSWTEEEIAALEASIVWKNGDEGINPMGNESYCYTNPIELDKLGSYELVLDVFESNQPESEVLTLGPVRVLVRLADTPLANAKCEGCDCCLLTVDCLYNLKDRLFKGGMMVGDPFITKSQNPAWDDLCPFPVCAYGYMLDNRVMVGENGSLVYVHPHKYRWEPEEIPVVTPDPVDCIIRSPISGKPMRHVDCNLLTEEICQVPKNTYDPLDLKSKKSYSTIPDYSDNFNSVLCSELSKLNCQYINEHGNVDWASCDQVYITRPPSHTKRDSLPQTGGKHVVKRNIWDEVQPTPGACVRYLGPSHGNMWLYHTPYTSMLHCLADQPRSTAKWCTSIFQAAYYECKKGAGLVNGG